MNSFVLYVPRCILFVSFCLMTFVRYIYVRSNGAAVMGDAVRPIRYARKDKWSKIKKKVVFSFCICKIICVYSVSNFIMDSA